MEKDLLLKSYLSDDERFADLINGFAFGGEQIISETELQEMDSQTGFWMFHKMYERLQGRSRVRYRDLLRRVALGVNFVIIGVENQEEIHYAMPLRNQSN